ncbi:caspase family protein [Prosthecomicrobium sp. N25]|uniref:caspase family protein n=1 Tax=Prosthecomicrobium sp. N25 TaxID=3129254 RepID=UPI00307879A1
MAFLLCAALAWADQALAERRVALVIGNSAYKSIVALKNTRADAEDVSSLLRELGFEVMTRLDVERASIPDVLKDFSRLASGADVALFYFAGHALQHQGGYFLVPVDAKIEDEIAVQYDLLPARNVEDLMEKIPGVRIMIFDACRNDPFQGGTPSSARPSPKPGSATRGLTRVVNARGMVSIYATAPLDVAEDGRSRNSPFTAALLARAAEPNVDIVETFRRVSRDVQKRTDGRQVPQITTTLQEEFVLSRRETDLSAWAKVRFSSRADDLRDFAARFPNSAFRDEARFRLDVLERELKAGQDRTCAQEAERIDRLVQGGDRRGLVELRGGVLCPASAARIDAAVAEIDDRAERQRQAEALARQRQEQEACNDAVQKVGDAAAARRRDDLQRLKAGPLCARAAAAADEALARLDRLAQEEKAAAEACERERTDIESAVRRRQVDDLRKRTVKCPANLPLLAAGLDAVVRQLDDEARQRQAEQTRKACEDAQRRVADFQASRAKGALAGLRNGQVCEEAQQAAAAALAAIAGQEAKEICDAALARIESARAGRRKGELTALRAAAPCDPAQQAAAAAVASLEEAEKAEAAALEAACLEDLRALAAIPSGRPADVEAFLKTPRCPEARRRGEFALAEAGKVVAEAKARQEKCREEGVRIDAAIRAARLDELAALRPRMDCPENMDRLARAIDDGQKLCAARLDGIRRAEADNRRDDLQEARRAPDVARCPDAVAAVDQALRNLDARAAEAQARVCREEAATVDRLAGQPAARDLEALRSGARCPDTARLVEAATARLAEAANARQRCAEERADLARAAAEDRRADLSAKAERAACPDVRTEALAALRALDDRTARRCAQELAELTALDPGRPAEIQAAVNRFQCPDVRQRGTILVASAAQQVCTREKASLEEQKLQVRSEADLDRLRAFVRGAQCPEIREVNVAALTVPAPEAPRAPEPQPVAPAPPPEPSRKELVARARDGLLEAGCLKRGERSDKDVEDGIREFYGATRRGRWDGAITVKLVEEIEDADKGTCSLAPPAAPKVDVRPPKRDEAEKDQKGRRSGPRIARPEPEEPTRPRPEPRAEPRQTQPRPAPAQPVRPAAPAQRGPAPVVIIN